AARRSPPRPHSLLRLDATQTRFARARVPSSRPGWPPFPAYPLQRDLSSYFQSLLPVLEEAPRPSFASVVPQQSKLFFEQIGNIQPLVHLEQLGQGTASVQGEVFIVRQQCVLLAFNTLTMLARQAGIFALAYFVHGLTQMAEHMKLVEEDADVGNMLQSGVAKGFPHVHDRQIDAPALLDSQLFEEQLHALLRPILATKPDRSAP